MNKSSILASFFFSALVVALMSMSGFVDAAQLAQAGNTPRPTRDRTANPRATKTPQATPEPNAIVESTPDPNTPDDNDASALLSSQLVIVNPGSNGAARVTVNFFDLQGAIAYSDTLRIRANGAALLKAPPELGSDFLGSARSVSNQRVQALVVDSNGAGTASDAYEASNITANTLTLPFVLHNTTVPAHSLIAVQNTSALGADATFTAYDTDGNEILAHPFTLAPHASVYLDTRDLIGANAFLGSARITADRRLAAVELTAFAQDTASIRALAASEANARLVIPLLERKRNAKRGPVAWSQVYVRNEGDAPTDITLRVFTAQGARQLNVTRANVPAGGMAVFDLRADEFQWLGRKFVGWARLGSTNKTPLTAYAFLARAQGKQRMATGAFAPARVKGRSVCGDVRVTAKQTSVLSLLNTDPKRPARVQLRFYNSADGALIAEWVREIAPKTQIRIAPTDGLPQNFRGIALLNADPEFSRKVVASVVTQTHSGKRTTTARGYVCP